MTHGTEGRRGKKREKQIKRPSEGNQSHGRAVTLGGLDAPGVPQGSTWGGFRSLWEQTQAGGLPGFLSSLASVPIIRGQGGPPWQAPLPASASARGVRAFSFQSGARFRCPRASGCLPPPSPSGPPRPAGTSTSVVGREGQRRKEEGQW